MTQTSHPWENQSVGDATLAPYSAAEWAALWNKRHGIGSIYPNYGVLKGTGGGSYEPLEVRETNPASANIEVQVGSALVNGRLYENDAVVTLAVSANASGNTRLDTVVLRADFVLQTVRAAIKVGTPAATPDPPALQQDATLWEEPLANIRVSNGFSTIAQEAIMPRRRYANTTDIAFAHVAYPLVYAPTAAFTTDFSIPANGGTLLIPMVVPANMLLYNVVFRMRSTAIEVTYAWDLYTQDVEDRNPADGILRRVARSNGNVTVTLGGAPSNRSAQAEGVLGFGSTPGAIYGGTPLTPGIYWLALQNRHAANAFNIGSTAASAEFSGTSALTDTTVNPNGATLDASGFFAAQQSAIFPVRLQGLVLGELTLS